MRWRLIVPGLTPEGVEWTRQALGELTAWASNVEGGGPPIEVSISDHVVGDNYRESWHMAMTHAIGYLNISRRLVGLLAQEREVPLTSVTEELGEWLNSGEASL
jgi:hypothetical protein